MLLSCQLNRQREPPLQLCLLLCTVPIEGSPTILCVMRSYVLWLLKQLILFVVAGVLVCGTVSVKGIYDDQNHYRSTG